MKKASISISYDEEKFSALKLYIENKKSTVEDEMIKALDLLYTKTVPAGVREFIDLRNGNASDPVPPKVKKPKSQVHKPLEQPKEAKQAAEI
jgi:hypothetical protein